MKKIFLLIIITLTIKAQVSQTLIDNLTYANSDTVESVDFPIYDSLQVMIYASDTVNVDMYLRESASKKYYRLGSKLLDFISVGEKDTSLSVSPVNPAFTGKLYFIFNSTGNDTESDGRFRVWIKHFKHESNYGGF